MTRTGMPHVAESVGHVEEQLHFERDSYGIDKQE